MEVCYTYDGTFYGYLTCVFDAYLYKEPPAAFRTADDPPTLWPERAPRTDPEKARRILTGLGRKVGPKAQVLARHGFLSGRTDKDLTLYRYLHFAFAHGPQTLLALAHPDVAPLLENVRLLENEAHLYKGFVRFSQLDGVLVGEIEPQGQVLPLLRPHFCTRLNTECFVLHDRTHRQALFYRPGRWALLPVEDFRMAAPDEEEQHFRALWRTFFNTIAIEGRINPTCQRTNLPLHFRRMMTEFQ